MQARCINPNTKLEDTGFGYTLSLIGGKYKMIILYWLGEFEGAVGNHSNYFQQR